MPRTSEDTRELCVQCDQHRYADAKALRCCNDRVSPSRVRVMNPEHHSTERADRRKRVVRNKMIWGARRCCDYSIGILILLRLVRISH